MSSCGYRVRQKCFCDFGPFFALSPHFWPWKLKSGKNVNKTFKITHVYHKWRSHDLCFLRYKAQQSFLSFWGNFCPLTLLTTWKIKILKKWNKNTWRYYHFTLKCIIDNDNHMMYGSWDMKRNRQKFLSFWAIFCPFTPLTTQKIKILKKKNEKNKNKTKTKKTKQNKKTPPDDIIFLQKCTKNNDHMLCCSWDMACDEYNCYFSFWVFNTLLTPPPPPFYAADSTHWYSVCETQSLKSKKRKKVFKAHKAF